METEGKIREVMAAIFDVVPKSIGEEFSREDVPNWDSLNHLRMITALEEVFGIKFKMREIEGMNQFKTIRKLVLGRLHG